MHRLLTDMPIERLTALYTALPEETVMALASPIAQALNSRPTVAARRPEAMRVKALRAFLIKRRDDDLAAEILRAYFLGPRVELVKAFLDGTGVEHEDGTVEDEDAEPDASKVAATVKTLLAGHEAEDVHLYLEVARRQWPDNEALTKAAQGLQASA